VQLAYATVTLLIYARHFGRELLSGGQAGRGMPRTASQKAAAVLNYTLTATGPDDPHTAVPLPVVAELPQRADVDVGAEGRCEAQGLDEEDLSVADAEGWELLSKRGAPAASRSRLGADNAGPEAAAVRPDTGAGARAAGAAEGPRETPRKQGLRQRGGSHHAGEGTSAAASDTVGSERGAERKLEAAVAREAAARPIYVLWMCGIFTLQVGLHLLAWNFDWASPLIV
jgi:hypothetical protein